MMAGNPEAKFRLRQNRTLAEPDKLQDELEQRLQPHEKAE
jgi:hypothetical protein